MINDVVPMASGFAMDRHWATPVQTFFVIQTSLFFGGCSWAMGGRNRFFGGIEDAAQRIRIV